MLFPVKQAPFYAVKFEPQLGETMVTCGGILTDGEQNAIDKNYEPIPGLYVSGNDCGRRFGAEYITPIPGCSLGIRVFFRNDPCKLRKFIGHTVAFRLGAVHTGAAAAHAAQYTVHHGQGVGAALHHQVTARPL